MNIQVSEDESYYDEDESSEDESSEDESNKPLDNKGIYTFHAKNITVRTSYNNNFSYTLGQACMSPKLRASCYKNFPKKVPTVAAPSFNFTTRAHLNYVWKDFTIF